MSKTQELYNKRAKLWKETKDFLDTHTKDNVLSAEDKQTYERMENEMTKLTDSIEVFKRQDEMDKMMAEPTAKPIIQKPESNTTNKRFNTTDEYKNAFWNVLRMRKPGLSVVDALREGADSEGGFLVPEEYERQLISTLDDEYVVRSLANCITTSGVHKIPIISEHGTAAWIEEEGAYQESDESFGQIQLDSFKLATTIKVSEELVSDSAFDLDTYLAREFSRRIGAKEEDAFINGDGNKKPTGILADINGAETGVSIDGDLTADDIIDLYYSLRAPYRKNAKFLLNDDTVRLIRKLKDADGQYIWRPGLDASQGDRILGAEIKTSVYMPTVEPGKKSIAFGDFNKYWIANRQGIIFKRLNELYALTGHVGYTAMERVDGRLVVPEAIKVLKTTA